MRVQFKDLTQSRSVRNADRMNQHGMHVLPRSESPWGNFTPQNRTYRTLLENQSDEWKTECPVL